MTGQVLDIKLIYGFVLKIAGLSIGEVFCGKGNCIKLINVLMFRKYILLQKVYYLLI